MLTIKQYLSPPFKARVRRVGQLALLAGLFEISRLSRFESGTFAQFGSVQALALYVADALSVISDVALVLAGALILGAVQSRTEFTGEGRRTELHPGVLAGRSPAWLAAAIVALSVASRGLLWEHYAYIGLAQCALAAVKLSAIVLLCAVLLNAAPGQLLRAASRWWPLALTLFAYLQLFFHPLPMAALNRATVAVVRLLLVSLEGASALSMHEVANGTWIRLGGFEVDILPVCSGYEGLFLFSGLYLSYALIARCRPGLMMVVIWLAGLVGVFSLNAVRIVGLLELGARLAPQGAIYGFHSRFGILAVLAVACCAVLALERVAPRTKTPEGSQTGKLPSVIHLRDLTQDRANLRSASDPTGALRDCMPLAVMVGLNLAVGIYRVDINWLYPLVIVFTLGALWQTHRGEWHRGRPLSGRVAVPTGVAVYGLWLALVPINPARSLVMETTLSAVPGWLAGGWIAIRLLGAVCVVPVVEELAFRRGLWRLVDSLLADRLPDRAGQFGALLITSAAFAAMHTQPLAAFVAGLAYGGLRISRSGLSGAILAHGITNALLGLQVIITGQWAFW